MTTARLAWLDSLRLLAGLSMLCLHASSDSTGGPWADYSFVERSAPVFLRTFLYVARTELFLIISIFLLIMSHEKTPRSYAETIGRQGRRILPAFLFWTCFYAVFSLIKAAHFGYLDAAVATLAEPYSWARFLLLGDSKYHMHFLPTLFALLLFYPMFLIAKERPTLGVCALCIGLVFRQICDGAIYAAFWDSEARPFLLQLSKVIAYIGYGLFAASAFGLWRRIQHLQTHRWLMAASLVAGPLFAIKLYASWLTIGQGRWVFDFAPAYWADFLLPALLFMIFALAKEHSWQSTLSTYAKYSFGIYLTHPIALDVAEIWLMDTNLAPIAQVLIKIGICLPVTLLLVFLLKRNALTSWTIGLGATPSFSFTAGAQRSVSQ